MRIWPFFLLAAFLVLSGLQSSCTCRPSLGSVNIDGSSTVYVISEAVAEEYQKSHKSRVSIGISGTGGGFKKLCSGRINIIGASRAITKSELELCKSNKIVPTEFAVAMDGIVVVVNPKNTWVNDISINTLKLLFEPAAEGKVNNWNDIDPSWPARKIAIFTPGISSGTYDYFTKAVVGTEHASRGDITSSEDDNVLVHGVRSNLDGIGFFSLAYYLENKQELKALPIIGQGAQAVMPSNETIQNGSYQPLSRPIFIYAAQNKFNESERNFLRFYLENSANIASDVGFVALKKTVQNESLQKLAQH